MSERQYHLTAVQAFTAMVRDGEIVERAMGKHVYQTRWDGLDLRWRVVGGEREQEWTEGGEWTATEIQSVWRVVSKEEAQ